MHFFLKQINITLPAILTPPEPLSPHPESLKSGCMTLTLIEHLLLTKHFSSKRLTRADTVSPPNEGGTAVTSLMNGMLSLRGHIRSPSSPVSDMHPRSQWRLCFSHFTGQQSAGHRGRLGALRSEELTSLWSPAVALPRRSPCNTPVQAA